MTDLPLVFSVTGVFQGLNAMLITLPTIGLMESSLELFRIRSLVIGGAILPILVIVLHIWMPSHQKYHKRVTFLVTLYWVLVALFGTSDVMIMIFSIPVLLVIGVAMTVTFIVTWKTGRLKEVRSELLVVAAILGLATQILRVPLMTTSMFYLPDVMLGISMFLIALAIANPWYAKEKKRQVKPAEIAPMMDGY